MSLPLQIIEHAKKEKYFVLCNHFYNYIEFIYSIPFKESFNVPFWVHLKSFDSGYNEYIITLTIMKNDYNDTVLKYPIVEIK